MYPSSMVNFNNTQHGLATQYNSHLDIPLVQSGPASFNMAFSTAPTASKAHRFDISSFSDSDSSSTITSTEDSPRMLRLPTRLMIALTCGIGGCVFV